MAGSKVEVHLFKDDHNGKTVFEEMIRVRLFSQKRPSVLHHMDAKFADAKAYKGGPEKMVEDMGGALAEAMNAHPKFKDDHDPEAVARAAVEAYKDALVRAERNGFGKFIEISDDEQNVAVKATGGKSET